MAEKEGNLNTDDEDRNDLDVEGSRADEEEQKVIEDSLDFVDDFFRNIKRRGDNMPVEAKKKLDKFKSDWSKFFVNKVDKIDEDENGKRTGTRSKVKTNVNRPDKKLVKTVVDSSVSESDSVTSGDDLADDLEDNGNAADHGTDRKKQVTVKKKDDTVEKLVQAMSKLDSRNVPSLECFDETSGQDLGKYFVKFENYCQMNFKGDHSFWIGELEGKLRGRTLEAFNAVKDNDDSFSDIKSKLLEWWSNFEDIRKKRNKQKFAKATYARNETLSLYAARLEKNFKVAFPSKNAQTSRTLLDKYVDSIPKKMRKLLKSRICDHKYLDEKMKWSMVKKWARTQDAERDLEEDDDEDNDDIVISVGTDIRNRKHQDTRSKDVSTQLSESEFKPFSGRSYDAGEYRQREERRENYNRQGTNSNYIQRRSNQDYNRYPKFERPSDQLRERGVKCHFCGRLGHLQRDCYKRLTQCYACGSPDHFIKDCPYTGGDNSNESGAQIDRRTPSAPPSQNNESRGEGSNDNASKNVLPLKE